VDDVAAQIVGYGIYLPRQRIALEEINRAWGRGGGRGEKAVAPSDEDAFTLGLKAAKAALEQAEVEGRKLGVVYFVSTSTGYGEGAFAAQMSHHLGAEGDVIVGDFGLSARSVTVAMRACMDSLAAGYGEYGLVVAAEKFSAEPGSTYELSLSCGAGALIFSQGRAGFAEVLSFASHTSGFIGRFRREGEFHGLVDERFHMQQFLSHVEGAVRRLSGEKASFDHVILQAPEGRWGMRLMKRLGLPAEKLISTFAQIGYAGSASLLIDLASAFERASPEQRILAASYGPGGSDALTIRIVSAPPKAGAQDLIRNKELVSYPTYLRYHGLLR